MRSLLRSLFVLIISSPAFVPELQAQVPTGVPQFGSFQGGPIDTVNLATLNVHFEIPIRKTPGRGLPFSASLGEENSHYYPHYQGGGWYWFQGISTPPAPWFFDRWPLRTLLPFGIPTGNSVTVTTCGDFAPWGGDIGFVSISNNVLTVYGDFSFTVGQIVRLNGLTSATFLNGKNVTVASVSSGQFTATFNHANYPQQTDNGNAQVLTDQWQIAGYTDIHNTVHGAAAASIIDPYGCLLGSTSFSSTSPDGYVTTGAISGFSGNGYTLTVSVTAPSGTVISSGPMRGVLTSGALLAPSTSTATDTNGNQISVTNPSTPAWTLAYADATGNNVLNATTTLNGSGVAAGATYSYTGPNNTTETVTVTSTSPTNTQTNFGCSAIFETSGASYVTTIGLPDGSSYQIGYGTDGRISSATLPTGGTVSYNYNGPNRGISCQDGGSSGFTRTTPDGTWTYSRSYSTTTGVWTTTVTDPQGNNTLYTFSGPLALTWVQGSYPNYTLTTIVQPKYEVQRQVYQLVNGNQVLMRTLLTCYNGNFTNCATATVNEPITQIDRYTYLPGVSNPSLSETKYNNSELLTEDKEFDFNAALPPGNNQVSDRVIQYGTYSSGSCAALGNNLLNRPCTDTTTGGGSTLSQSTHQYDANGNLLSLGSLVSGSTFLTKTFSYYSSGLINVATDVNGGTTTYTYGACNGSFPTNIAASVLNTSMTWDCTGETPTSIKDANNQTTTYSYVSPGGTADPFWRLLQENFPDGGQTSWTYNGPTSTTTTTKMNSSQNIVSTTLLDGLGRVTESQLCEDGSACSKIIRTDTTYDALGRPHKAYNATRCNPATTNCGEATWGYTIYAYDALGRTTQVTDPDGSISTASYSGNCQTVTDEAGKSRQSCFDGLGRLTQITEDPGSSPHLNYVTSYTFDALSNLTNVTQNGGRQRTYVYDALSRLTRETNPETGSITYSYNSSGDLSSKVSPAQNQNGSGTITVSYCYDQLHRITAKAYTYSPASPPTCSGTPPTFPSPAATFLYDQSSVDGDTHSFSNPIGRLVKAEQFSFGTNATAYFDYDSMGRIYHLAQCAGTNNCTYPGWWVVTNSYDLSGNLTSYTDAFGHTLTQSFDAASRPLQLTSSWVDSGHPATLATVDSSVGYYPPGALRKMNLANGLTQTGAFNNTLQPCRINWNSTATALGACSDAIPSGNLQDFNYGFNAGSSDNGDVMSWTATGQQAFTRSFSYDSLNRLSTMQETSGGSEGCKPASSSSNPYNLTWGYDAWGNRTSQSPNSGTCSFSATVNSQNQLSGSPYQYDAAGNMTSDGNHTYFYDAENRLVQIDGTFGTCSSATACYVVNGLGQRVAKYTNPGGVYQYYVYGSDGQVVSYTDTSGIWNLSYLYFGGARIAEYAGTGTYFFHTDHLGSTRLGTDMSRNITTNPPFGFDFLPFGEQIAGDNSTIIKFTGHQRDAETNLDHTQFRQYSSQLGRWMHPDPAGLAAVYPSNPQSWNRYSYALNNPLRFIDSTGLFCEYFDDSGTSVESLDYTSSVAECGQTGGTWVAESNDEIPLCDPSASICVIVTAQYLPLNVGDNVGGGGGFSWSSPNPTSPANSIACGPAPKGFGILLGGQAGGAAGAWKAGAAASGSAQVGAFFNSRDIANLGAQASGGAVSYSGNKVSSAPAQIDQPRIAGAYVGYGPALTLTNAGSAQQLSGPFQTVTIDIGVGLGKASVTIANSGNIWTWTLSGGPWPVSGGLGGDLSYYTTTTKAIGTGKCP